MYIVTLHETMFPARLPAMAAVREFLDVFCCAAQVERPPSLRLHLVVEELFTNTVTHGHRGDCDFPVWITLEANRSAVNLTYLDQAPPFNPLAIGMGNLASLDSDIEHRKVGGLGVLLATELTSASEYAYLFGRNRLRMMLLR